MLSRLTFSLIVIAVSACAAEPQWQGKVVRRYSDGRAYVQANWATVGVDEASEKCYAEVASNPLLSHYICMKSKGYQEQ